MPELVTVQSRPVKRRRCVAERLRLTLFSPVPRQSSEILIVTQQVWLREFCIQFFPKGQTPNVQALRQRFVHKTHAYPFEGSQ
jgi:hypothetical protein